MDAGDGKTNLRENTRDGRALSSIEAGHAGDGRAQTVEHVQHALAHIPLFGDLSETERTALGKLMTRQRIAANQTVFWRGDKGDAFYLVDRGNVAVTVPNDNGEHIVVAQLGAGGFFGEISLLDAGPRTASVRAVEDTDVFVLRRAEFHAFLRQNPNAAIHILTVM